MGGGLGGANGMPDGAVVGRCVAFAEVVGLDLGTVAAEKFLGKSVEFWNMRG